MPKKNIESAETPEEQAEILEQVKVKAFTSKPTLCGHVNKHHMGLNGKPEDLACTLPAGHDGEHSAEFDCLRPFDGSYEQAKLEKVVMSKQIINSAVVEHEYVKVKDIAYWSDGAGIPAADIKPDLDQLAALRQSRQPGIDGKAYAERHGKQ